MCYVAVYRVLPGIGLIRLGCDHTVPWTILYRIINHVVRGSTPCANGKWTRSTGQWTMSFRTLEHNVPGNRPYGTGQLTMSYRALDNIVTDYGSCVTGLWTMC